MKMLRTTLSVLSVMIAYEAGANENRCVVLADLDLENTVISQSVVPEAKPEVPQFCQVDGTIDERIGFIMRMPTDSWNGKFTVAGCGGFCGALRPDKQGFSNSMIEPLKSGYAVIQTDGGHQAESWDTDWAIGDDYALELFAGAWMPLAVATGQALIEQYYGQEPRRNYFSGCSNGGRLGMFAAQRYPDLFDGIAAGAGIFDLTGNSGVHGMWILQTTRDSDGKPVIDRAKLPLLSNHVASRCDVLDGVEDGVVARPQACKPNVAELQCAQGQTANCFTATEVRAIERLYQGANVNGEQLFSGVPPGSEHFWSIWLIGTEDNWAWGEKAALGNLRLTYGVPSTERFNAHDYVLADELETLQTYADVLNATDPDLSGLEKAGHKLFMYQGMADPLILAGRAREYHDQSVAKMGAQRFNEVANLTLVPGFAHCWEKSGLAADLFDPLAVVDRWVETGEAPENITAVLLDENGQQTASQKLCPYPEQAEFVGGDKTKAENFECR